MLFTSLSFIIFFIITLMVYVLLVKKSSSIGLHLYWLILSSLFFYGAWNPKYLILLLGSIYFNYLISCLIYKNQTTTAKTYLILGIVCDLSLLAYYKYANFFLTELAPVFGVHYSFANTILPLGISFYTFTQIAFLVDVYRKEVSQPIFSDYLLFITYFPHLIAGPILHHKEIIPQFKDTKNLKFNSENINIGLIIFLIGLCKKIFLADNFAVFSNNLFDHIDQSKPMVSFIDAWVGTIAYSLQIYFDFSGYCDMAIGLSKTFGILLPLNFYSPYKATSIIDFWRRWHITLSRWLRDYLYIPLGGSHCSTPRRFFNLFITMLIGGFWHGASWAFIIWGGLHGSYLIVNHAWQSFVKACSFRFTETNWFKLISIVFVFMLVSIAWVFFRSNNLYDAIAILKGLLGFNSIKNVPSIMNNTVFTVLNFSWINDQWHSIEINGVFLWLFLGLGIVWLLPNTIEIFSKYQVCLITFKKDTTRSRLRNLGGNLNKIPRRVWGYMTVSYCICFSFSILFYTTTIDRTLYRMLPITRFADIDNKTGDFRSNLYATAAMTNKNDKIIFVGSSYSMGLGHFNFDYKGTTYKADSAGIGGNTLVNGFRTAMASIDTPNLRSIVFAISPLGFSSIKTFSDGAFHGQCFSGLSKLGLQFHQAHLGQCEPIKLTLIDKIVLFFHPDSKRFYQLHGFFAKLATLFDATNLTYTELNLGHEKGFSKRLLRIIMESSTTNTPIANNENGSDKTFKWEKRSNDVYESISPGGYIFEAFRQLNEECKKRNIRLVVYDTPTPRHINAPHIYPPNFLEQYERIVQASMSRLGIEYYNFIDMFPWNGVFMVDFIHPVADKRPIIAKAILYNMYGETA